MMKLSSSVNHSWKKGEIANCAKAKDLSTLGLFLTNGDLRNPPIHH
jgi:hypothetical protein